MTAPSLEAALQKVIQDGYRPVKTGGESVIDLVPLNRIFTGEIDNEDLNPPYITITRPDNRPILRSGGKRLDLATVMFSVWVTDYELGRTVTEIIRETFEPTDGSDNLTDCEGVKFHWARFSGDTFEEVENGFHLFEINFEIQYES